MSDSTVYVSIGNSDDKLTQMAWSSFYAAVEDSIDRYAEKIHGRWVSGSAAPYQNGCWCIEVTDPERVENLKGDLRRLAHVWNQDAIAWATATTEFLGA